MDQFRAYLAKKYGTEAAQSVKLPQPPITPAILREAEAQAAKFKASAVPALPEAPATAGSARSSAGSSFRGHAVQTKKKIGENADGDLWGFIGKFERLHFQRENELLAKEAVDRKLEYKSALEKQMAELHARRNAEVQERISDYKRMQQEQEFQKQLQAAEKAEKDRMRAELREFMASEEKRKSEKLEKKRLREKLERERILEIMAAECAPGAEIQAPRINRKKEDNRAPWEKEDVVKELDIKAFCHGLDAQLKEKSEARKREEEVRALEKQVLDLDTAKAREEEAHAQEERKKQRKRMDAALIKQMDEMFPLTKDQKMNRDGKNKDLFINQPLVRLMAEEPHFLNEHDKHKLLLKH